MSFITENSQKWSQIISEEFGVSDKNKLGWMSQYAQNHEVYESLQSTGNVSGGIYSTPLNTIGMGNPMMPSVAQGPADFHSKAYQVGSGDVPMSTLTMSLEVAAMTIGLELVPVIPMNGPWAMLSYMDFPYAGGKLGRVNETALDGKGDGAENKPIYIKVKGASVEAAKGDVIALGKDYHVVGKFLGKSRIDGAPIVEVFGVVAKETEVAKDAKKDSFTYVKDASIADAFSGSEMTPDLVAAAADHIQGFANFVNGSKSPMTRAENETGVGNTIGARMFTKMVQAGSWEVTGSVTRQQLQDMPLYGVDVIGKVLEQMQNTISQHINRDILDRVFALGVTNAKLQKDIQGVDLNLFFGTDKATLDLKDFSAAGNYFDIHGVNVAENWGAVKNATQNTSAENFTTHQRRIMSRVLAASNLVANVSRFGRANWVVTNTQIATALQDCAGYVVAPMVNNLAQDGRNSLYFAGSIAGLNVYVDPYMGWNDCRVCVGRKSDGNTPGVVFAPYILADTVQTVVEGTMAPKILVNSRYALIDFGFHPEQNYYTFMVDTDGAYLI